LNGIEGNAMRGISVISTKGSVAKTTIAANLNGLPVGFLYSGNRHESMARNAIEKFGELPRDILDGTRRSRFAPPLVRHAETWQAESGDAAPTDIYAVNPNSSVDPHGNSEYMEKTISCRASWFPPKGESDFARRPTGS
jgi:hypothetical protein